MTSPEFNKLLDEDTPLMNPRIADGFAVGELKKVEQYIDSIFKLVARTLPKEVSYIGWERATPHEEFAERTRRRENKSIYEIARTDFYMVKYYMAYNGPAGQEILSPIFMYLPFCGDAGLIHVSGSRFNISPVLMDRVISVGPGFVFLGPQKGKVTYRRIGYGVNHDGKREEGKIIWGWIYNRNEKVKPTTKCFPTIPNYLFAKHGVTKAFKLYANADVFVHKLEDEYKIDTEKFSIYKSNGIKPKGVFTPNSIVVAIPREQLTPLAKAFAETLIYIADHFPERVHAEYVDTIALWTIILGYINQSSNISQVILQSEMENHMLSVDEYLDEPSKEMLKTIDIHVEDFYQLSVVVMERFNEWTLESQETNTNSMWGKYLTVLPHICSDITSNIVRMGFRLNTVFRNIRDKSRINKTNVERIVREFLKPGRIYGIREGHRECASMQYPGDNKVLKITSILIPQSAVSRKGGKKRLNVADQAMKLHASIVEVGGFINLPKSEPSGRSRINLFVQTDENGVIVRDDNFEDLLNDLQSQISD